MRKSLMIVLAVLFVSSLVVAEDQYKAAATAPKAPASEVVKKAADVDPLNNVVRMDAQGNRTALCICGQEFPVTAETKAVQRGDQTFYAHNQECYDIYMNSSKEVQDKIVSDYTKNQFPWAKLASNATEKDGKKVATCLCGRQVDVNDKTEHLSENGVTMYVCSDACKTALHGMSAKDRMAKEMAWVTPAKTEPVTKEAMGTRK